MQLQIEALRELFEKFDKDLFSFTSEHGFNFSAPCDADQEFAVKVIKHVMSECLNGHFVYDGFVWCLDNCDDYVQWSFAFADVNWQVTYDKKDNHAYVEIFSFVDDCPVPSSL